MELLKEGKVQIPIKAVWTLDTESVREAHRSWGRISGIGSMVVKVGDAGDAGMM